MDGASEPGEQDMKVRALIVDDEPLAREWVRAALREDPEVEVLGECGDGLQAVEKIEQLRPDAVFLDVQMPGLDGFGVLEMIPRDHIPAVIFVTAFDQYALRAFEAHAVDYVMKPFSHDRLLEAVKRVKAQVGRGGSEELKETLLALMEDIRRERAYPDWLLIKNEGKSFFVKVKDIDWIESSRNNVRLHVGQHTYLFHETTAGVEAKLDPRRFMRIHRSTIVNIERIKEMHPWFNGEYSVTLRDGTQLTMSSTYREKLKDFRRIAR
jgi:two-component system LytT family response regulator